MNISLDSVFNLQKRSLCTCSGHSQLAWLTLFQQISSTWFSAQFITKGTTSICLFFSSSLPKRFNESLSKQNVYRDQRSSVSWMYSHSMTRTRETSLSSLLVHRDALMIEAWEKNHAEKVNEVAHCFLSASLMILFEPNIPIKPLVCFDASMKNHCIPRRRLMESSWSR